VVIAAFCRFAVRWPLLKWAQLMPATGGQYVFLREAFGPLPAFLCGWTFLVVSMTGASAWMAVSFCRYLGYFIQLPDWGTNVVGCSLVLVLTWINYRGVVLGAWVQKIFTGAKLAGIFALIIAALLGTHTVTASVAPARPIRLGDFGVAMIACLLAYDGWVNMSFVAGEISRPQAQYSACLVGRRCAGDGRLHQHKRRLPINPFAHGNRPK